MVHQDADTACECILPINKAWACGIAMSVRRTFGTADSGAPGIDGEVRRYLLKQTERWRRQQKAQMLASLAIMPKSPIRAGLTRLTGLANWVCMLAVASRWKTEGVGRVPYGGAFCGESWGKRSAITSYCQWHCSGDG